MFKIRISMLLAVAIAAFAVSAVPAMAQQYKLFVAKASIGQVKGKSISAEQIFKTENGEVKCKTAEASGHVTQLKAETEELEFKYGGCKAFSFPVTISPVKYTFTADGVVKLNNEVKIEVTACKLIVPGGQTFAAGSVIYENNKQNLKGESVTKGIEYKGTGTTCPHSNNNGVYEGSEEIEGNKPPDQIGVE